MARRTNRSAPEANGDSRDADLSELELDPSNPRFPPELSERSTQRDILNVIVRHFGVDDVLSSISVSGYFAAEPLVCRERGGKLVVVEGNRRLAACLILAGHDSATDHPKLREKYQEIHARRGLPRFNPVPVIVFGEDASDEMLTSYLGVRHIVSTKEWDSYAKARWISQTVASGTLALTDIAEMIGDTRDTIRRMLQGYNFIAQLEREGKFDPNSSVRKGRGSNTRYPFSWVYTILGYKKVRDFTSIDEDAGNLDPIPEAKLDDAQLVVRAMFGDTLQGLNPSISDSRQISSLADAVGDPEKVSYLRQGKKIEDINRLTSSLSDLLRDSLIDVRQRLREVSGRLQESEVAAEDAREFLEMSAQIQRHSKSVHEALQRAAE